MQFQDKASNCKSAKGIEELQKWESYVIELVFLEREFWYLEIDVQCGKKRPHMVTKCEKLIDIKIIPKRIVKLIWLEGNGKTIRMNKFSFGTIVL